MNVRDLCDQAENFQDDDAWPQSLDLAALSRTEPTPPQFIMDDWLPCGYATLLAGHGGVGKSAIALHLAVCIAAGVPFFGAPVERRRVMYLSCEDRTGILHWRLRRICDFLELDLASLREWLAVVDLVGHDVVLWERDPRTGNTVTAAYVRLTERMREYQTEVLFVDGISDTYGGSGGSKTEVKRYVNALVGLLPADRGALVLIGHIDKKAARNGASTEGYDGTTGWHNAVRARLYLYPEAQQDENSDRPERTGELILDLQKTNYGRIDQQMKFRWDEQAHLFVGAPVGATAFDRKHRDREEQDGIRRALKGCMEAELYVPAAKQGSHTAYGTLSLRPEFPESLKGGGRPKTRRFNRQIEMLRQLRHIEESNYRRANRHKVATLVLTAEGRAACV
jgi:RecA-family ATPase